MENMLYLSIQIYKTKGHAALDGLSIVMGGIV